MLLSIDAASSEPIFSQLCNQIIDAIVRNELVEGESLPSIRNLALDLGVNMHTVNKAYAVLKEEGYVSISNKGVIIEKKQNYQSEAIDLAELETKLDIVITKAISKGIKQDQVLEIISQIFQKGEQWFF
ncbi:MAG: GntR family transcriptional regulator [Mycoplasmatales bacterium]